ncbi:MAG: hypothetical protein ACLFP6_11070 [Spirochaetaceae bacterium]
MTLSTYWLRGALPALGIALLTIVLAGCPSGTLVEEFITVGRPGADTETPPTVSGAITIEGITTDALRVSWPAASDDTTPAPDLEYRVVYSTNQADVQTLDATLTTIANTPTNSASRGVLTAGGVTTQDVTGLPQETRYWVNVVVSDRGDPPNVTEFGEVSGAVLGGNVQVLRSGAPLTFVDEVYVQLTGTFSYIMQIENTGVGDLVVSDWTVNEIAGDPNISYSIPDSSPPLDAIKPGETSEIIELEVEINGNDSVSSESGNWTIVSTDPDGDTVFNVDITYSYY